jgi:hypothetical protein
MYLVKQLLGLYLSTVAVFVFKAKAVNILFEDERDAIIGYAKEKQIYPEEDSSHPQIHTSILQFIVQRRAQIYIVHSSKLLQTLANLTDNKHNTSLFLYLDSRFNRLRLIDDRNGLLVCVCFCRLPKLATKLFSPRFSQVGECVLFSCLDEPIVVEDSELNESRLSLILQDIVQKVLAA